MKLCHFDIGLPAGVAMPWDGHPLFRSHVKAALGQICKRWLRS